ncbi:MAG TPA: hypothetical protein VHG89_00955 [Verrucomicrobiae bacterium]|nr:hypothetical protein [Verrucomicrobiae bacterium]
MNPDTLNHWLDSCAAAPGMIGGGFRLSDGTCLVKNFNDRWSKEQLEMAVKLLAEGRGLYSNYGFDARWLTWTFAKGEIRVATRPDGLVLALAAEPDSLAAHDFNRLSEEFLAQDFAAG